MNFFPKYIAQTSVSTRNPWHKNAHIVPKYKPFDVHISTHEKSTSNDEAKSQDGHNIVGIENEGATCYMVCCQVTSCNNKFEYDVSLIECYHTKFDSH